MKPSFYNYGSIPFCNSRYRTTQSFSTQQGVDFPFLVPGDQLVIWGSGVEAGRYTIKRFVRADGQAFGPHDPRRDLRIQFHEQLEQATGAPADRIRWRAAWLPAAIKVTLTVSDPQQRGEHTVQRVFHLARNTQSRARTQFPNARQTRSG